MITVNDTKIIPNGTSARLEMVLNLHDTSRSDLVPGHIADFERKASIEKFGVDEAVDGGAKTGDVDAFAV